MNTREEPPPLAGENVYVLNGIPYYPHYREAGQFVGPGRTGKSHSATQLIAAGAKHQTMRLWQRYYNKP